MMGNRKDGLRRAVLTKAPRAGTFLGTLCGELT